MKKQFLVSVVLLVLMITVSKPSLTQSLLHLASCVGSACVALGPPTAAELASDDGSIQYTYGTGGTATTQHVNASMYAGLTGTQDVLGLYKWEIGHTIFKAIACSGLPTPSAGYGDYCFDTSKTFKWKDDTGTLNSFGGGVAIGGAVTGGAANAILAEDASQNLINTGCTYSSNNIDCNGDISTAFNNIYTGTSGRFWFGKTSGPQGGFTGIADGVYKHTNAASSVGYSIRVATNGVAEFRDTGNTVPAQITAASGSVPAIATSTDPGCTLTAHVGRMWVDNTSAVTTHFKVCAEVASSPAWVTVF
jgi:hypothetical protein